jgi:hypothetical protein
MKTSKYIRSAVLLIIIFIGIAIGCYHIYLSRYDFSHLELRIIGGVSSLQNFNVIISNSMDDLCITVNYITVGGSRSETITLSQSEYDELRKMINKAYRVKPFTTGSVRTILQIDRRHYALGVENSKSNLTIETLVNFLSGFHYKPVLSGMWKSEIPCILLDFNEPATHIGIGQYIIDGDTVEIISYTSGRGVDGERIVRIMDADYEARIQYFSGTFTREGEIIYFDLEPNCEEQTGYAQIVFERIGEYPETEE